MSPILSKFQSFYKSLILDQNLFSSISIFQISQNYQGTLWRRSPCFEQILDFLKL